MLRIHLMRPWFGYSDPAMDEALHEVPLLREFAGLDAGEDAMPDETTLLKFRRLPEREPDEPVRAFPCKRKAGAELTAEQSLLNRMLAPLRAVVEHPFRIVQRQFGYVKVRYRGLFKKGQPMYLLFALGHLYQVRRALTAA